eukprot:UN26893
MVVGLLLLSTQNVQHYSDTILKMSCLFAMYISFVEMCFIILSFELGSYSDVEVNFDRHGFIIQGDFTMNFSGGIYQEL